MYFDLAYFDVVAILASLSLVTSPVGGKEACVRVRQRNIKDAVHRTSPHMTICYSAFTRRGSLVSGADLVLSTRVTRASWFLYRRKFLRGGFQRPISYADLTSIRCAVQLTSSATTKSFLATGGCIGTIHHSARLIIGEHDLISISHATRP